MSFYNLQSTLSAAVATNGTFTFAYPAGTYIGTFSGAKNHKMWAAGLQTLLTSPTDFTVAFTTVITVTYKGTTSLPVNTRVQLQLETLGANSRKIETRMGRVTRSAVLTPIMWNLGSPITASSTNIVGSQSITLLSGLATGLNGSTAGVLDQPRNVVAAWTGTAVLTVTGTDEYGVVMHESSASGTSFTGKKAFMTVTNVTVSADVTSATVGTGVVLGLPSFLSEAQLIFHELIDGALATAGTTVAGDPAVATATTGDVRGTLNLGTAQASDGSKVLQIEIVTSVANIGSTAGLVGVTQA